MSTPVSCQPPLMDSVRVMPKAEEVQSRWYANHSRNEKRQKTEEVFLEIAVQYG